MRRTLLILGATMALLTGATIGLPAWRNHQEHERAVGAFETVRPGMRWEEVVAVIGRPSDGYVVLGAEGKVVRSESSTSPHGTVNLVYLGCHRTPAWEVGSYRLACIFTADGHMVHKRLIYYPPATLFERLWMWLSW